MFTSLLFLILLLMIINLSPEMSLSPETLSPLDALLLGVGCYIVILLLIFAQNRFSRSSRSKNLLNRLLILANSELILFFLIFHFFLGAYRAYWTIPFVGSSYTLLALVPLIFYFIGIYLFYRTSSQPREAATQVRFLLPFCLPFLLFDVLFDLSNFVPVFSLSAKIQASVLGRFLSPSEEFFDLLMFFAGALLFLIVVMIFFPAILQKLWGCKPLPEGPLKDRLDALCSRLKFRHAGIKTWPVLKQSLTAGVIGIVSKFRYVMFTKGLIQTLPPSEVEAVLAHEIGHSRHYHLLIYPFIIFGMGLCLSFASMVVNLPVEDFFGLLQMRFPDSSWSLLGPLTLFVIYALIVVLYFRYVFGLFSRNFEREADLYSLVAGVDGNEMISALDRIAVLQGNIHKQPNWHHFSIEERILYLKRAMKNPKLIKWHTYKIYFLLVVYFFFLKVAFAIIFAPFFPTFPISEKLAKVMENSSLHIDGLINRSLRQSVAKSYIVRYHLDGEQPIVEESLTHGLRLYPGSQEPGAAEFYAAKMLLDNHDISDSIKLMTIAWQNFDFSNSDQLALQDFENLTGNIINQANAQNYSPQEVQLLREVADRRLKEIHK